MNYLFPNDEPLIAELAFPQGMRVFVGPQPGFFATVNWEANPIIHRGVNMRLRYPDTVPVKQVGACGRNIWINKRWLAPAGKEVAA